MGNFKRTLGNVFLTSGHTDSDFDFRYKAEPSFSPMANGEAAAALDLNEAEEEKPPENEELVRGPAILLTTGFRGDKEMFVIVQTNKLSIYKDELHFTVKPGWVI